MNGTLPKHSLTACLRAAGWVRDNGPAELVPECVDIHGCSRPGRWSESGYPYCAQHAHQGTSVQWLHLAKQEAGERS